MIRKADLYFRCSFTSQLKEGFQRMSSLLKKYNFSKLHSPTMCKVTYDSFGKLKTRPGFPFFELANCSLTSCLKGQYLCKERNYCIDINNFCDGVAHCHYGDDEENCSTEIFFFFFY